MVKKRPRFSHAKMVGLGLGFTRPGKHTKNYGKSPFFMGKSPFLMERSTMFNRKTSTISIGPFSSSRTVSLPEGNGKIKGISWHYNCKIMGILMEL
jgi:hypothetical protein